MTIDPGVLNTVIGSMAVTAVLTALPKPGTKWSWSLVYKFIYDTLTGFRSLKTGAKIDPTQPVTTPAQTK
jgi:hypothetical protein